MSKGHSEKGPAEEIRMERTDGKGCGQRFAVHIYTTCSRELLESFSRKGDVKIRNIIEI